MKTVTAKEMRDIELAAERDYGIHPDVLMDTAGHSAAEEIINTYFKEKNENQILVICGSGNNGGDGLVTARYLLEHGLNVYCYIMPSDHYKELVMKNIKRAFFSHLSVKTIDNLDALKESAKNSFIIIDALIGIGFEGRLREEYAKVTDIINASGKTVISFDVPTGLNADSGEADEHTVRANSTYTFGFMKRGLSAKGAEKFAGQTKILPTGLPEELIKLYS
ncbi:NAD(P)H-hydrate epimerase [Parelusimicrobium proximum]|uniref:NAD(P)H-hydrate epimerase n=1 Tax=Parelusimicrobium proximum TaxID=3228953 RepID=UPI003D1726C6